MIEAVPEANLCDVCRISPMVGVFCTSMPISVAYCYQCALHGADPELVFLCWEVAIPPDKHREPDNCLTFKDGAYVTYRQWYDKRRKDGVPIPVED